MTSRNTSEEKPTQPQTISQPTQLTKTQLYAIVLSVVLIGAVLSSVLIFISLSDGITSTSAASPVIEHIPINKGTVGESITIKAKVTSEGSEISNVTLHYQWSEFTPESGIRCSVQNPWQESLMLLVAAGGDEYAYTIPSDEVAGDIDYLISASDKEDRSTSTPVYLIEVADFYLEVPSDPILVYIGGSDTATIAVKSVGDFSSQVSLSTSDTPYGIEASIAPSAVKPPKNGMTNVQVTLSASPASGTFRGTFELKITGESGKAEHSEKIEVTIPSFETNISPSSITITKEETAQFNIKVSPSSDFKKEVTFSLEGLPDEGTEWEIIVPNNKLAVGSDTDLRLVISTEKDVEEGTYPLLLTVEGGGIELEHRMTLTIKK